MERSVLSALIPAAHAHEKWFLPANLPDYPTPDLFYSVNVLTIAAVAGVIALTIAGFWVDRLFERSRFYARTEKGLIRFREFAPGILAKTAGVLLLWNGQIGSLVQPNFPLPDSAAGFALNAVQVVTAAALLLGWRTRASAVSLAALCAATFFTHPSAFPDQVELLYLIGISVFLFHFPRPRFTVDRRLSPDGPVPSAAQQKRAYVVLRVLLGLTLIDLALTNKWLHPGNHFALMDAYADLNPYVILHWFGFDWLTREYYVFLLAASELIIGIYVMAGFLTRIAALLLIPLFFISTAFLPIAELLGHLPVIGTLFTLFVFGDTYHKQTRTVLPDRYIPQGP